MIKEIIFRQHRIILIGTGHVFKKSILEVKNIISREKPKIVCVELDRARYHALMSGEKATFLDMIRNKGLRFAIFGSLLSMIQGEVGEDFGVIPGTDMLVAIDSGMKVNARIFFIDRPVDITLSRLVHFMTLKEKIKTIGGALLSLTPLKREIHVSQFDENFINDIIDEFKKFSPNAFQVLIEERNIFMVRQIVSLLNNITEPNTVVVVVGAGHIKGVGSQLEEMNNVGQSQEKGNNGSIGSGSS
ncbi:MAG: TraB family protein [Candidatus Methanofastidiosia archaeon]